MVDLKEREWNTLKTKKDFESKIHWKMKKRFEKFWFIYLGVTGQIVGKPLWVYGTNGEHLDVRKNRKLNKEE